MKVFLIIMITIIIILVIILIFLAIFEECRLDYTLYEHPDSYTSSLSSDDKVEEGSLASIGGVKIENSGVKKSITIFSDNEYNDKSTFYQCFRRVSKKEIFEYYEKNFFHNKIILSDRNYDNIWFVGNSTKTYTLKTYFKDYKILLIIPYIKIRILPIIGFYGSEYHKEHYFFNIFNKYNNIDFKSKIDSEIYRSLYPVNLKDGDGADYLLSNIDKYPNIFISYMKLLESEIKKITNNDYMLDDLLIYFNKNNKILEGHLSLEYYDKRYKDQIKYLNTYLKYNLDYIKITTKEQNVEYLYAIK